MKRPGMGVAKPKAVLEVIICRISSKTEKG